MASGDPMQTTTTPVAPSMTPVAPSTVMVTTPQAEPSTVTVTVTPVTTLTIATTTTTTTVYEVTPSLPSSSVTTITDTTTTTTTLAPVTITTTPPASTVTAISTTTQPASTITAVSTLTQPTTAFVTTTVFQPTTVTAPPATTPGASLVVDSTVQLTAPRTFELTGSVQPKSDIVQIEFYAQVDGQSRDLGAAALNTNGTFTFSDHLDHGTQGFITAVATDSAGRTSSAVAPYSLSTGPEDAPSGSRQDNYDPSTGAYTGSTVFYPDGTPKTVTSVAPDGSPLVTSHFRPDGFETTEIQAPGQTVTVAGPSLIENHGSPETDFVFVAGHRASTITEFRADGSDHDTLSLPSSDYQSIADVLKNTTQTANGAEIRDPVTGDTVTLDGVSKQFLKANANNDIKFHG